MIGKSMEQKDTNQQRKKAFRDWFVRRWAEWDASTGRRSTQQELADYLGVGRPIVSHYVSGISAPSGANLAKIARRFGFEVYEVLGVDPPEDQFSRFPDELAARLRAASAEIETLLNAGEFAPNSPEHAAAAREIFARYGFSLKEIEISDEG